MKTSMDSLQTFQTYELKVASNIVWRYFVVKNKISRFGGHIYKDPPSFYSVTRTVRKPKNFILLKFILLSFYALSTWIYLEHTSMPISFGMSFIPEECPYSQSTTQFLILIIWWLINNQVEDINWKLFSNILISKTTVLEMDIWHSS